MKKRIATKKFPMMALAIMFLVVGAVVFGWNTITQKMSKPLNTYLLPFGMLLLGAVAFFMKNGKAKVAAAPLLLGGVAIAAVQAGHQASTSMSAPNVLRLRRGVERPALGMQRPALGMQRPAFGMQRPAHSMNYPAAVASGNVPVSGSSVY